MPPLHSCLFHAQYYTPFFVGALIVLILATYCYCNVRRAAVSDAPEEDQAVGREVRSRTANGVRLVDIDRLILSQFAHARIDGVSRARTASCISGNDCVL